MNIVERWKELIAGMDGDKDLLLMSAARLYAIGVDLEEVREELRRLVECGTLRTRGGYYGVCEV